MSGADTARDRATGRAALYKLLALGFWPPDPAGYRHMQRLAAALLEAPLAAEWGLREPLENLARGLEAEAPDRLEAEYHRLFGPGGAGPSNQSAYLPGAFGHTREMADIAGFYRGFGLEQAEGGALPDFIGVELEFMALAAGKEGYAAGEGWEESAAVCREGQRKFLQEHLGRWALPLARRLGEQATGGTYTALAALLAAAVAADARFLGVALATGAKPA